VRKFIIEREMPGVGSMSEDQVREAAVKSNQVLDGMHGDVQWLESYVTDDKIYCVYIANDEKGVREHARQAGFPADRVSAVTRIMDPTTADLGGAGARTDKRPSAPASKTTSGLI
jgi:hypothetical protein